MRLSDHQAAFTADMGRLICIAPSMMPGYRVRLSYVERSTPEQQRLHDADPDGAAPPEKSQHPKRLAGDLLLDKRTESGWDYVTTSEDYRPLAVQWELMSVYNRAGIRWGDGNHFERLEHPRREQEPLYA